MLLWLLTRLRFPQTGESFGLQEMRQKLRECRHPKNTGEEKTAGLEGGVPSAAVSAPAGIWDGSAGALRGQERTILTHGWGRPRPRTRSGQASYQPCTGTASVQILAVLAPFSLITVGQIELMSLHSLEKSAQQ